MSWKILTDESAKTKREKKRKRKIKRGSKQGRYVVLGSRGRKGRKSALRCTVCGRTLRPDRDGLVCNLCGERTAAKVEKYQSQMEIPDMSIKK